MTRARALRAVAVGVVLAVLTATTFTGLLLQRPLPTIDGHYRLLGLHERAEIVRDAFGVPRIEAGDAHDLFFLQGYITAQDRFAQMDAMRASAPGRPFSAAPLDERAVLAIDAYAAGVSKYIEQHAKERALPAEVALSGRRPASWTTLDTLAVATMHLAAAPASPCTAVGASRALRGAPLLAAELTTAAPAPGWYQIGLQALGLRGIGVSLPGVPGIVAGHNGTVAWALHGSARMRDPSASVSAMIATLAAASVGELSRGIQNGPLAGCLADAGGSIGGLTPYQSLGDGSVTIAGGAPSASESRLRAFIDARGLDVEAMRLRFGPTPPRPSSARIVVDLGDLEASKAALSTGQSGHRAAFHYRDQAPLWEAGQLHRLAWTREAVARTEGQLVFRPR